MTRERLLVLGVGLAVVLLLGALLDRAIRTVEREEALRHEQLADRVFDELERELQILVDREEARPFLHYSYAYVPDNDAGPVGISRSPLADLPDRPEVLGYFQIGPDGEMSTPYRPSSGVTTNPVAAVADLETRLVEATAPLVSLTRAAPVELAQNKPKPKPRPRPTSKTPKVAKKAPIETLNRGLKDELPRQSQTQSIPLLQAGNFVGNSAPEDFLQVQQAVQAQLQTPPDPVQPSEQQAVGSPPKQVLTVDLPSKAEIEVVIEPFTVLDSGPDLVLYRTVALGGNRWVQGLVLKRASFLDQLEASVLGQELGEVATVSWAGQGSYTHAFRAPFEDLVVGLDLERLPPRQSTAYFWVLAAILLAVVGLAAALASRWLAETARLSRQRADFVAAVSHELRSPLTSIRMYSEMLEQGMVAEDDQRDGYYRTIRQESERLGRLVEDVLAFSKLERGQERSGTTGSLGEVVDEVGRLFRPITDRDGFELQLDIAADAGEALVADRDALVQVLTNLVDNAVKFSRDREVRSVAVSAQREEDGVSVTVRDSGPGVDPAFLPRIFDAFTRGEAELTRKTKGTGIGLALVQGLVEELGGRVSARNLAGGFEVVVHLPA